MASVDDELGQIERDIRTLKIEYEQYFGGGRPRPPADTQWRVDSMMRRYNERMGELSVGQRFRFNNIQQTYAKYQDMWRKKLTQKETGAVQHHYGAAAKAIEAERARQAAQASANGPNGEAATQAGEAAKRESTFALSVSDPDREREKVTNLYQHLIDARAQTGESSGAPSLKDFERFVRQKTKELKDKGGKAVEYSVSIEGGRVKLKAKVSASRD
ncbi:MAG TPA: MXAN_5187 C-terminal domain-containing protein [Candidatus Acidoferrum sp.]|nr:MXAN_5187 C-terminal domain-containing protein [Candidatus Acidoferrum sp.]